MARFFKSRKSVSDSQMISILSMSFLVSLLSVCIQSHWVIATEYRSDSAILVQLFRSEYAMGLLGGLIVQSGITFAILLLFFWISPRLRWLALLVCLVIGCLEFIVSSQPHVKGGASIASSAPAATQGGWW
jgi:hypothetical protein